ncbi:Endonuclease domain-containing 1 protein [Acropora cervicornis]|uniref:Endonuclease domain-containing 1 protein n=1 Tax=Acropora cervicornis TaxID=6130 RepID=A0AAD9PQW3_ACRCE|nr:Endonuclease domain-containing 1 protein [Acropora cervicornis]
MKFIMWVTFAFFCTPGFSGSKAAGISEEKGKELALDFSNVEISSPRSGFTLTDPQKRSLVLCTAQCYLKYFAGQVAPTVAFAKKDRQKVPKDCFATYFDNNAGIAAYSAYTITASNAKLIGTYSRPGISWKTTPGSSKPGIDKGHLNPSLINSYDEDYQIATFTYTNAVPQFKSHNRRSWENFEGKIANYVKRKCGKAGGNMYLITGTSNYLFDSAKGQQIEKFPNINGILRPNSLWTAGCCVVPGASTQWPQSIAVWGNNHKIDAETEVMSLTNLEQLLVTSTSPADLFPAFPGCRTNSYLSLDQLSSVIQ